MCTFEALCIHGGENFKRGITIERELRVSVANEIVGRLPKTSDTLPFVDLNVADNRGDINGDISSLREMGLLITGRRILVTVFQDPSREKFIVSRLDEQGFGLYYRPFVKCPFLRACSPRSGITYTCTFIQGVRNEWND